MSKTKQTHNATQTNKKTRSETKETKRDERKQKSTPTKLPVASVELTELTMQWRERVKQRTRASFFTFDYDTTISMFRVVQHE